MKSNYEDERIEGQKKYLLLKNPHMKEWSDDELTSFAKSCLQASDQVDEDIIRHFEMYVQSKR